MQRPNPHPPHPPRGSAGFSLVEVLVASVILAVIALGLIPLYSRSIRSNVEGFDYTQVSNFAKSRAEEYVQLPFDDDRLDLPMGDEELAITDFYADTGEGREWVVEVEDGDQVLFERTTTVRQLRAADIKTPVPGGELADLKEITVQVEGTRAAGSPFGGGKAITVRVLKSE